MLSDNKIEIAIQSKVIYLTKKIMQNENCNEEIAYKNLINTKIYEMLLNKESGLYLEPAEFITEAYELERDSSIEDMIEFINS